MKSSTSQSPRRPGFTLVELLVSMALTLFIMVILVEAFTAGLDTFQGLRSLGGLQSQLRSGLQLIRYDLQQEHFGNSRRCSDANFWDDPRREGFFAARQGSVPGAGNPDYTDEGPDLDGINRSYLARDHVLHFATRLRGNRREQFVFDTTAVSGFSYTLNTGTPKLDATTALWSEASIQNSTTLASQWSEIAYFLQPAKSPAQLTTIPGTTTVLHNLYRAQLVVLPLSDCRLPASPMVNYLTTIPYDATKFKSTSCKANAGKFQFFAPSDLALGPTTRAFDPANIPADPPGKSLACTNVVSFQVRIMKDSGTQFEDFQSFDSATKPAGGFRLVGVQIILRVFDPASGLTRQATLTQDF